MADSVAGIALPEGEPGAIFDAAARLAGAAAAFGDASQTVGGAVAQVGAWQGQASASFRTLAAGYEQAGATAAEALRDAAISVRRYGVQFEDAYDAVQRLQREAETCVEQIEVWEGRRADAADREAAAQMRASTALLGSGLDPTGTSLAVQAEAYLDADAAATERMHAEQKLAALRDELEDLRRRGRVERDRAEASESQAAQQVANGAGSLPAVHSPGGGGATAALGSGVPAVYRGGASISDGVYRGGATTRNVDFLGDLLNFSRDVDREMGPVDEAISDGVQKTEGVGREVLGINDAERSKQEFQEGNILGGLFYGALASPFGKWGKGAKEAGEEVVQEAGERIGREATQAGARGADEAPDAYHYTARRFTESIETEGLRPGSYVTNRGDLSPLQAQIDLALPPNRGLRDAVLRVDLDGLRKAGYEVPDFRQVGRSFNMPGGGQEIQFPYDIPPKFVKVVRP